MKKLILLVLLSLSLISNAQTFTVTPDGLRSSSDETKDFLVIPIEGKSANELYMASKKYINKVMTSPNYSIKSDVENDYIRYSVFIPQITSITRMLTTIHADAYFQVELSFKDGRIKYEISGLDMPFPNTDNKLVFSGSKWKGWAFFDEKGKLLLKKEKPQFEGNINSLVEEYVAFINNAVSEGSDW